MGLFERMDAQPDRRAPRSARSCPVAYLVGEHERSSARPADVKTSRTLVCVNGRWHGLRGTLATFEQILALPYPELDRPYQSATVTYRRGSPTLPQGSLTPGDVEPIVAGMLVKANATVLS